jgi:hypothetical protein
METHKMGRHRVMRILPTQKYLQARERTLPFSSQPLPYFASLSKSIMICHHQILECAPTEISNDKPFTQNVQCLMPHVSLSIEALHPFLQQPIVHQRPVIIRRKFLLRVVSENVRKELVVEDGI